MSKQKRYGKRAQALDDIIKHVSQMPIPVHGNWCGPNYGSGNPIDELDSLCQTHDDYYSNQDYLNGDKIFVSSLAGDSTLKARAIASFFKYVVIPMRQNGLLAAGSSSQLISLANNYAMKSGSRRTDSSLTRVEPTHTQRPPSSYNTLIAQFLSGTLSQPLANADYLWKDGTTTPTADPTAVGTAVTTPFTWGYYGGNFPGVDTPRAFEFASNQNQAYELSMDTIGIYPATSQGWTADFGIAISTTDFGRYSILNGISSSAGSWDYWHLATYNETGKQVSSQNRFFIGVLPGTTPLKIYPYVRFARDTIGDFTVNSNARVSYALHGLVPVVRGSGY
jgi:hypothetical protein